VWVAVTNIDPKEPAVFDLSAPGLKAGRAVGQTLSAPGIDSVNTFDAPNTVMPKPVTFKASGGKLILTVAPASVTVVSLEQ